MDQLEQAFVETLESYRRSEPNVIIRVREVRDVLGEKFIRGGEYRTSQLTAEVAALIRKYRSLGRLEWIGAGVYIYALEPTLLLQGNNVVPQPRESLAYIPAKTEQTLTPDESRNSIRELAEIHFSSVAQLAASDTFLVMGGLNSVDFETLNGVSF